MLRLLVGAAVALAVVAPASPASADNPPGAYFRGGVTTIGDKICVGRCVPQGVMNMRMFYDDEDGRLVTGAHAYFRSLLFVNNFWIDFEAKDTAGNRTFFSQGNTQPTSTHGGRSWTNAVYPTTSLPVGTFCATLWRAGGGGPVKMGSACVATGPIGSI
jgi:hypothetical protein